MRIARRATMALILALATFLGACGTGERFEVPVPDRGAYTDLTMNSVYATSANTVFVAGVLTKVDGSFEGIILGSQDGGKNWRRLGTRNFPFEGFMPQALHFNDALRGWVSGIRVRNAVSSAVVLRTEDGGAHWLEADIPESKASVVASTSELRFESDTTGTVHVFFLDGESEKFLENVYESRDAGRHWDLRDFKQSPGENVTDAAEIFVSPDRGFRLQRPMLNGTQILEYTGSQGKSWLPASQFHIDQLVSWH